MTWSVPAIAGLVVAMGAISLSFRTSFVLLLGRFDVPSLAERALQYVPAAVLAGLVVPELIHLTGDLSVVWSGEQLVAAVVAAAVARRTENVVATIAAGMAVLWAIQFL